MELKRLANLNSYREVEAEWKYEFTTYALVSIGVPEEIIEECFPEFNELTTEHKIKIREHLEKYDISIIDDLDGGLKFYVDKQLVAEWVKCFFIYREDNSVINPKNRIYIEIVAKPWTIFEEVKDE